MDALFLYNTPHMVNPGPTSTRMSGGLSVDPVFVHQTMRKLIQL